MEWTLLLAFMQQSSAELGRSIKMRVFTLKAFLRFGRSQLHHTCISNTHMILAKGIDFYMHRST